MGRVGGKWNLRFWLLWLELLVFCKKRQSPTSYYNIKLICTSDTQCTNVPASQGRGQNCNVTFPSHPPKQWYIIRGSDINQHSISHHATICAHPSISRPGDNLSHLGEVKPQGADGLKLGASQHVDSQTHRDASYALNVLNFQIAKTRVWKWKFRPERLIDFRNG